MIISFFETRTRISFIQSGEMRTNIATGETSQAITSLTFSNRQLSSIDNLHQQTIFINRKLLSIDNFHQ